VCRPTNSGLNLLAASISGWPEPQLPVWSRSQSCCVQYGNRQQASVHRLIILFAKRVQPTEEKRGQHDPISDRNPGIGIELRFVLGGRGGRCWSSADAV
ncbi:MAG TPA: hypothetical protein VH249_11795, partial [Xanthobacteraceae bacterium]|nr:hypothetical protein [Xanthobacteraceae bacterium]